MAAASLSDVELAQVVAELAPVLAGTSVGKCHVRDRWTVVLETGRRARLLVSVDPQAARVHLEGARPAGGAAPSAFAMLLRKHLTGLRIDELAMVTPGERVVRLGFGANKARLVAELGGPAGNVYLLDSADNVIGSLRPAQRGLVAGAAWTPPPPAPPTARWRGLARYGNPPGVADRVATELEATLAATRLADLRVRAAVELRRRRLRLERRLEGLAADMSRIDDAAVYRKWGDLILAHPHVEQPRGEAWLTLPDLFAEGAPPLRIAIDPALDLKHNADRYYRQHRRLTGKRGYVQDRIARTRAELDEAARLLEAIDTLDEARLDAIAPAATTDEAPGAGRARAPRRRVEPPPRLPYRAFHAAGGEDIWVGRSARDNDAMRSHARGNDLWLHTRDAPGSHVILRLGGRPAPSPDALVDAATLAAHFSPLAREAQVDVQYTQVKNLRKPKGAPAGLVTVSAAKTIRVRLEPARLERLLAKPDES